MAQETSNYKLIKPDDGAFQWGEDLNANFDTIDRGLSSLATSAANTLVCVGLFGNPSIQYSGDKIEGNPVLHTQIDFIKLNCYFPSLDINNGIVQSNKISLLVGDVTSNLSTTWTADEYKVYSLLLTYDSSSSNIILKFEIKETLDDDDFTGNKIYLGNITLLKHNEKIYFVRDLCCFTPWFANYSLKDRIENFNTTGIVQNLILESNKQSLSIRKKIVNGEPTEDITYNWYLEGINFNKISASGETTWETNNSIATNFLTKNDSGQLALYMAVDNNKYNASELEATYAITEGKYWNGSDIVDFDDNKKYAIYRISIVKNKTLGVFYPTKLYTTFNDARSAATNLEPIHSSIPQKEVARLITDGTFSKVEIYNFYSDEYVAEGINSYLFYTDPQKEGYTLADASEIRSNGILPIYDTDHYITVSGTALSAKGVGCIVDSKYNFQKSTLVNYFNFETEEPYDLSKNTANGINYIYLNQNNTITIGSGDILLGYYFKGTKNKWICCPDLCTTTPDKRNEREYDHLHIPNGIISTNDANRLGFNNATPELYGEGINYNSGITNFNKKILADPIKFSYINGTKDKSTQRTIWDITTESSDEFKNTTTNYSIQVLILTADGNFFMIPGSNETQEPSEAIIFQNQYDFPPTIGIEMARLLFNGSSLKKFYFTNKNYIGSIQIMASTVSGQTKIFSDSEFAIKDANEKTFTVAFGNSFKLTSTAEDNTTYDLNTINTTSTDVNNINKAIGTTTDKASATGSIYARLNQHTNEISNIANSIVKTGTTVPDSFNTWIFVRTDTNNIYIWDGSKYQLMNSWQ